MIEEYYDKDGKSLTKQAVQQIPPEQLSERSGIPLKLLPVFQKQFHRWKV